VASSRGLQIYKIRVKLVVANEYKGNLNKTASVPVTNNEGVYKNKNTNIGAQCIKQKRHVASLATHQVGLAASFSRNEATGLS